MPMIYVSDKTLRLILEIEEFLRKNVNTPGRVLRTDIIHAALEEYAKKLNLKKG